eukprot:1143981-Pelagomonas_calceolata.AAC.7
MPQRRLTPVTSCKWPHAQQQNQNLHVPCQWLLCRPHWLWLPEEGAAPASPCVKKERSSILACEGQEPYIRADQKPQTAKSGLRGPQTKEQQEEGKFAENTAKAKGRQAKGRQASRQSTQGKTRAGMLKERTGNNTRERAKTKPKGLREAPRKKKLVTLLQKRQ